MGFFDKFKQAVQAAQQMADGSTQISITVDNQTIKIGENLQGTIVVTSVQPNLVSSFQITLFRELDDAEEIGSTDRKQWLFNKEIISANLQLQANEPQTFPFSFIVKDGLNDGLNYVPDNLKADLVVGGVDPVILPDTEYRFKHRLSVLAKLNNSDFGPFTVADINFSYAVFNSGIKAIPEK